MNRTIRTLPFATVLIALCAAPAHAQESPSPASRQAEAPAQVQKPLTLTYQFEGGSITRYLDGLRDKLQRLQPDLHVNVVRPDGAADFQIPAMQLTDVSLDTAIETLEYVKPDEVRVNVKQLRDTGSAPVYVVMSTRMDGSLNQVQNRQFATFSLRDLATPPYGVPADTSGVTVTPENALNAIRLALSLFKDEDQPELLYHEDSQLLFLRGTAQQRILVDQVISQLRTDVNSRRAEVRNVLRMAPPSPPPTAVPTETPAPPAPPTPEAPHQVAPPKEQPVRRSR